MILREYARRARIALASSRRAATAASRRPDIVAAIGARVDLVVVSDVIFNTGQRLDDVGAIVACDACGRRPAAARRLPFARRAAASTSSRYDVDFAVGGSYKYLRGGPGRVLPVPASAPSRRVAAHARHRLVCQARAASPISVRIRRSSPTAATRSSNRRRRCITCYQARAGQRLRWRWCLRACARFARAAALPGRALAAAGCRGRGGTADRGAFVVVETPHAARWCAALAPRGIATDARGPWLRLCPDVVTRDAELSLAAAALGVIAR